MAIMRIAFAAAALVYIAPHFGVDVFQAARPLIAEAGHDLTSDAVAKTVLAYCQKNPDACVRMAKTVLHTDAPATNGPNSVQAELRPALPDKAPLPPSRPIDLRPALK